MYDVTRLNLPHVKCHYYSDSTCVLAWIRTDPFSLKTFISNRVMEIQEVTNISNWHHVKGTENPADCISRGCFADELINHPLWLHGPPWLVQTLEFDDQALQGKLGKAAQADFNSESKTHALALLVTSELNLDFSDYSDLSKLLRVVCYILRFIHNATHRYDRMTGPFSSLEYHNAELRIVYLEQRLVFHEEIKCLTLRKPLPKGSPLLSLNPFIDDSGFIRVRPNRNDYNFKLSYEQKVPICVPNGHFAKLLIRYQHLFLNHSGPVHVFNSLRDRYWIIHARTIAFNVQKACVRCQRHDSRCIQQPPCPLPVARINEAPPFSVSGLDYAGPLFCSDYSDHEFYILLITCAVTRAVHIELTDSLNLSDCMLALRRFCARRGMPRLFYSDNAPTFVGAHARLRRIFQIHTPQWRFIPPLSPWYGGWWEVMVKSVKFSLRKTLHNTVLTRVELVTLLTEIEASVNSRPLVYVSDNINDPMALTPSHFLIGRVAGSQPSVSLEEVELGPRDIQLAYNLQQSTLEFFWETWSKEYIRNLKSPPASTQNVKDLKLGNVVLLKDSKTKRCKWPLGRIVKLYKGKDDVIRCVDVRTADGSIFKRSVQMLHLLEVYGSDDFTPDPELEGDPSDPDPNDHNRSHVQSHSDPNDHDTSPVPSDTDSRSHVRDDDLDTLDSVPNDSDIVSDSNTAAGPRSLILVDARGSHDQGEVGSVGTTIGSARRAENTNNLINGPNIDQSGSSSSNIYRTRSGRSSKPAERLDL